MNDEPNTEQWRRDDLVIHDADAKHPKMLMVVIGFTRDGLVKTQYLDRRGIRNGGLPRKVYTNEMRVLHNPSRFGIDVKGITPHLGTERFIQWCDEFDMMTRWNNKYPVGQEIRTTSADGGFVTFTGGIARMQGTHAHIWLVHTLEGGGGWWWLKFVEPVIETESKKV